MDEIKTIRRSLGMTQKAFAEALGVSQPTVSCWESGARPPSQRDLLAVRHLAASRAPADAGDPGGQPEAA